MLESITKKQYDKLNDYEDRFAITKNVESVLMYGDNNDDVPFISFVIPTYNRVKALEETIDSILNQSQEIAYEIVIVDNSANFSETNETYELIKRMNNRHIKYYINKENLGMEGNWNRCFWLARAKYAAMIHDDDLICNDYVEAMVKCINNAESYKGKVGIIRSARVDYYEGKPFAEPKNKHRGGIKTYRMTDVLIDGIGPTSCPTCGMLFLRDAVIEAGGFDSTFYPSSDYVLGYQIMRKGYRVYETEDIIGKYRIGMNESVKKEIILGFCKRDYCFREFVYKQNILFKIFGLFFRNVQYSISVQKQQNNARRFNVDIPIEEFLFVKGYGEHRTMTRIFYKLSDYIRRIFNKTIVNE